MESSADAGHARPVKKCDQKEASLLSEQPGQEGSEISLGTGCRAPARPGRPQQEKRSSGRVQCADAFALVVQQPLVVGGDRVGAQGLVYVEYLDSLATGDIEALLVQNVHDQQ